MDGFKLIGTAKKDEEDPGLRNLGRCSKWLNQGDRFELITRSDRNHVRVLTAELQTVGLLGELRVVK